MAVSPLRGTAPANQPPRDADIWNLFNGSPFAKLEYVDVVFPSTPDTDLVIAHTLTPSNPEDVRFVVVAQDRSGTVYQDQSATRRAWGTGYIILRCSAGNMAARLLLVQQRGATSSLPLNGGAQVAASTGIGPSFSGLHLRTHPDADKAANQVALLDAKWVVMNDGTRYSNLLPIAPLTADITTSGAGGLDTGSRHTSTWYEVYLIGKSSSRALADLRLIFHRAKDYKLDQSQTTTSNQNASLNYNTANEDMAQQVTPNTSGAVPFVDLALIDIGSLPSGSYCWVEMQSDSGGLPSGSVLATSDKMDSGLFATAVQWIRFTFRTPYTVTASTPIHLVVRSSAALSTSNYVNWAGESGGSGLSHKASSGTWTSFGAFEGGYKFYITENDTGLTLPTGYDQYCQLGWAYNDGSNVLTPFVTYDRFTRYFLPQPIVYALSSTWPILVDCSNCLPPAPVGMHVAVGNSTANNDVIVGGVPGGYDTVGYSVNGAGEFRQSSRRIDSAGPAFGAPHIEGDPIPTEAQALYARARSGLGFVNVNGFTWL